MEGGDLRVLPGGGDARDGRELLRGGLHDDVGEGLDVVGAAGPRPRGRPGDAAARERGDRRALAAGARGLAPEVVVHDVGARLHRVPLPAERRRPLFHGRRRGRREGQAGQSRCGRGGDEGLHGAGGGWDAARWWDGCRTRSGCSQTPSTMRGFSIGRVIAICAARVVRRMLFFLDRLLPVRLPRFHGPSR